MSARQVRVEARRVPFGQRVAAWALRHEKAAFLLVAVVWVLALYWGALHAPFVYDDLAQVVHNPNLHEWSAFSQRFLSTPVAFTSDLGGGAGDAGSTYRPLYWLTLFADARLWGLKAAGFHATNLLLHLTAGWLGFVLLRRLSVRLEVSAMASLVWLAMPIDSEVVAWVSGRSYSLCMVFVLLALIAGVRAVEEPTSQNRDVRHPNFWWFLGYGVASIAALLSNELGVVVLPLTLVVLWPNDKRGWRRVVPLGIAWVVSAGVWLGVKAAIGASSGVHAGVGWNAGAIFWRYVEWMTLPVHMSVERSTSLPSGGLSWGAAGAIAGVLALGAACLLLRRRLPLVCAGLAWIMVGLAPFCGFVKIYQGMAERFVYLGSAGLAFAVVALAFHWRGVIRVALLVSVAAWVGWGAWRLHTRVKDWGDPVLLYGHSLEANPKSPSLYFNLAFSFRQEGDFQGARDAYLDTITLQRDYPHALTSLGELYLQAGLLDDAEKQFVRAIALFPHDSSAYTNLGVVFNEKQLPEDAARMFDKAIENNATDPVPYFNLAVILQQHGHGELALPLYKKVLELVPGDAETLKNMHKIEGAGKRE